MPILLGTEWPRMGSAGMDHLCSHGLSSSSRPAYAWGRGEQNGTSLLPHYIGQSHKAGPGSRRVELDSLFQKVMKIHVVRV